MPLEIVRNDLSLVQADALVNAANHRPVVGYGVDSALHQKAGPGLLAARREIGEIPYGDAAITPAFGLNARFVIHAVTPVWLDGRSGETALLERCCTRALELALENGCRSVAFPLLAAGNHGFPKDVALQTILSAFSGFLMRHEMKIRLVVYDPDAFVLSEKLFRSVQSYIDENYIREQEEAAPPDLRGTPRRQAELERLRLRERLLDRKQFMASGSAPAAPSAPCAPPEAAAPRSLEDLMAEREEGFSEHLLCLIDARGLTDPDVYKRANLDRKHFSKIRKPGYHPSKNTALALAIALELSLDETRDLIGRAGHALSRSSEADIIVEYFILKENYNIFELNEVLFKFGHPTLGG